MFLPKSAAKSQSSSIATLTGVKTNKFCTNNQLSHTGSRGELLLRLIDWLAPLCSVTENYRVKGKTQTANQWAEQIQIHQDWHDLLIIVYTLNLYYFGKMYCLDSDSSLSQLTLNSVYLIDLCYFDPNCYSCTKLVWADVTQWFNLHLDQLSC